MKQSDISQQLGSLINQTQGTGVYSTMEPTDMPSELTDPNPLFELDYDDEQNKARKQAMETMKIIVGSVVPDQFQQDTMIQNKMKLDAIQLGNLYYQQLINNTVLKTTVDTMASGDVSPKLIEQITKLQNRAAAFTDQIIELQNNFRKYYIDSYLDVMSKMSEDGKMMPQNQKAVRASKTEEPKKISSQTVEQDDGSVLSGSKDIVSDIQKARLERLKKQAQEVEYTEE